MSELSPTQRLRQIAEEIRSLPEALREFMPGDVSRQAGDLFDRVFDQGAFAEHYRLRALRKKQKIDFPDDWQTGLWAEAITCLVPDLDKQHGPVRALVLACEPIAHLIDAEAAKLEAAAQPQGAGKATGRTKKRSTEKGEARTKIIAALTLHHKYQDGGCLNLEPIGVNELARQADVSKAAVSDLFTRAFKGEQDYSGHQKYKVVCRDAGRLVKSLKALNDDFSPHELYGRNPPGEGDRNEVD